MDRDTFYCLVDERFSECDRTMFGREDAYAKLGDDRLGSFKRSVAFTRDDPISACRGQMSKHVTCFLDMLDIHKEEEQNIPDDILENVLTDMHNYLYLLEALIVEKKQLDKLTKAAKPKGKKK